jgi:DNA-binding NarL/FixJ family response regulator
MKEIRVAIVEDHKGIRQGLEQLINKHNRFVVVGSYPDCTDIIDHIRTDRPDIVLMDIQLPGISGIEGIRLVKKEFPEIKLVVQTIFEDDDKIFESICAGASGYSSRVLQMFRKMGDLNVKPDSKLTIREYEVLQQLVNGLSYKQIAAKFDITYDTVRFHMKNIYVKLQVTSMTEAVAKALRQRLV